MAIWRPYQAALAGSSTVTLNRTGIGIGLLFPLLGVLLMLGGQSFNEHLKTQTTTGKRTRLGWLYIVAIGAIALTGYLVIESKFRALGYTV